MKLKEISMQNLFKTLAVSAASAAAMYYFDPQLGRRRRALLRERLNSVSHKASDHMQADSRQAADRLTGMAASAPASFTSGSAPLSDRHLREHVQSQLGRWVRHPRAIEVVVNQGNVSLRGDVLEGELDPLLKAVLAMPGVLHIDNRLAVHDENNQLPTLQGGGRSASVDGRNT